MKTISEEQRIGRGSGSADPAFLAAVRQVLHEIAETPDEQCLELKKSLEEAYLFNHLGSVWENARLIREGLSLLPPRGAAKPSLLDIGTSPLTFVYRLYFQAVDVATVDLTPLLAARCEKHAITPRQCDLAREAIPFETGSFDLCVFTEVMEHLPGGPGRAFAEIKRVLRPGGVLVFSLPNAANMVNRLRLLAGRPILDPIYEVFKEDAGEQSLGEGVWVHGFGHIREFTMSETLDLVRHYGFEPLHARCIDPYRAPPQGSGLLRRIAFPLYRIGSSVVPNSRVINAVLCRAR